MAQKVVIDISETLGPILGDLVAAQAICTAQIYAKLIGVGALTPEEGVAGILGAAEALERSPDSFITCGIARALRDLAAHVERGGAPELSVIPGGKVEG